MNLDVVYVNFHSAKELLNSIRSAVSCLAHRDIQLNFFIVDNSYAQTSIAEAQDFLLQLKCLERDNYGVSIRYQPSDNNLGFGKGCNKAASQGHSQNILFCNCDTSFAVLEPAKFKEALCLVDSQNAILGPKVVNEEGLLHASCFSFDPISILLKPARTIRKIGRLTKRIPEYKSIKQRIDRLTYEGFDKTKPIAVDWISGCFMLVNRQFFEESGGFDSRYFMYFEDVDLCRKARQLGRRVIFFPQLEVIHRARYQSSSQKGVVRSMLKNTTARHHVCSWVLYMIKWRMDFLAKLKTKVGSCSGDIYFSEFLCCEDTVRNR